MFKHLYKTLLISVISGSLLSFSPAIALAASDGKTQITTDSNGVITAKKNYTFEKISDADMLTSVTMLAGGFVTGRMLAAYRPVTMDVMIAAAGGAAFVAGEVLTNMNFKGKIDAMTVEVEKKNNQTVNEEQVKRLQDLKTSYEEAKKTTGYKKMLQMGSAAAFSAAGIAALYSWYTENAAITDCKSALATMDTALSACSANTSLGPSEIAACGVCSTEVKSYTATFAKYLKTRLVPKLSMVSDKAAAVPEEFLTKPLCTANSGAQVIAITKAPAAVCLASTAVLMGNQTQTTNLKTLTSENNFELIKKYMDLPSYTKITQPIIESKKIGYLKFLEAGLNIFFPKAEASWLPLLGLGASTAAAFFLISGTTAAETDLFMFVPLNRAAIWGGFAALSLLAAKSSDNVMKKLDANITKIDAILADLNKLAAGVKAQNLSQQGIKISTVNPVGQIGVSFSTDSTVRTDCMTGSGTTNCPALANKLSSMPGFANLPESFKDVASQSVALGDSLSGASGISGSTLSSAEALGNKANALANLLKSRQDAIAKSSNGKILLKKDEEKFQAGLGAKIRKTLASKGMTATGFMASMGGTTIDSSLAKKDLTPATGNKLAVGQNAINVQDGAGDGKDDQSLKLDFKEVTPGDGLSMGEVSSSGSAAKEYDIKTPEINGQFGPSLFELISGRYIKSGYPKLLEEEPSKN